MLSLNWKKYMTGQLRKADTIVDSLLKRFKDQDMTRN
jgi:hypothetical protein